MKKRRRRDQQAAAKLLSVPTEEDWGDYKGDIDREWTFKEYLGKSNADLRSSVIGYPLGATEALRYMAPIPFRYYALGFNQLLLENAFSGEYDSAGAASSFITAARMKLEEEPHAILPILQEIYPTLRQLCIRQEELGAPRKIYGDFNLRLIEIDKLIVALGAPLPE